MLVQNSAQQILACQMRVASCLFAILAEPAFNADFAAQRASFSDMIAGGTMFAPKVNNL